MSERDDLLVVPWRGGAEARVSRRAYDWITANVPEAATPEARADLYEIGAKLRAGLAAGNFDIPRPPSLQARRNRDAAVVRGWDALMEAIAKHPSYRSDHAQACEREGVDTHEAARYAAALRSVVDGYRPRPALRRGGPRGGGPLPGTHRAWMADAAVSVQGLLGISGARAAKIVADLVIFLGLAASAGSIRGAMPKRRL